MAPAAPLPRPSVTPFHMAPLVPYLISSPTGPLHDSGWRGTPLAMGRHGYVGFRPIASLCICIPTATITVYRCYLSWHFILVSVWKLVTPVTVACISIHRSILVRKEIKKNPNQKDRKGLFPWSKQDLQRPEADLQPQKWIVLFLAGTVVGMPGLCSLLWISLCQE
jgi:hypothetical protein